MMSFNKNLAEMKPLVLLSSKYAVRIDFFSPTVEMNNLSLKIVLIFYFYIIIVSNHVNPGTILN